MIRVPLLLLFLCLASARAASGPTALGAAPECLRSSLESAKKAGLHHIVPGGAGITRVRRGKDFEYLDSSGTRVSEEATLERIRSLRIPRGYRDVWISPDPQSHIQALAKDEKGRTQYRYHPDWIQARARIKFDRVADFGDALPLIRENVANDLMLPGLPRRKVLAALVEMLDESHVRIGNEEYAAENSSYGLTTLLVWHAREDGKAIHLNFRGKSGVPHEVDVQDAALVRIIRQSRQLPGDHLFKYRDEEGRIHPVSSVEVNDYLREITGGHFTAKDFRTWAATAAAARWLMKAPRAHDSAEMTTNITKAVEFAASQLRNTPRISRMSYIHPALLQSYRDGTAFAKAKAYAEASTRKSEKGLKPEERLVLRLLSDLR